MKLKKYIVPFFLFLTSCTLNNSNPTPSKSPVTNISIENPVIKIDIEKYSPAMSSTVGIGLTPIFNGDKSAKYHWTTDYGKFLGWGAPDYKVIDNGNNFTNNGEKVYWSYDPSKFEMKKQSFTINLVIEGLPEQSRTYTATLKGEIDEKGIASITVY